MRDTFSWKLNVVMLFLALVPGGFLIVFGFQALDASKANVFFWLWPRIEIVLGVFLVAYPLAFLATKLRYAHEISIDLNKISDLEAVRKEHFRAKTTIEESLKEIKKETAVIKSFSQDVPRYFDDLSRFISDDVKPVKQENTVLHMEMKKLRESLTSFARTLEVGLSHDLNEQQRSLISRLAKSYEGVFVQAGIDIINPEKGTLFSEFHHTVVDTQVTAEFPPYTVLLCKNWGFRNGNDIIDRAKVVVSIKPAEAPPEIPSEQPTEVDQRNDQPESPDEKSAQELDEKNVGGELSRQIEVLPSAEQNKETPDSQNSPEAKKGEPIEPAESETGEKPQEEEKKQ